VDAVEGKQATTALALTTCLLTYLLTKEGSEQETARRII